MKKIVLDTNILIEQPNILSFWSPKIELIVPDIVMNEVFRLRQRGRQVSPVIHNWEESHSKKLINEPKIDNWELKLNTHHDGLSRVDLVLAEYAKEISMQNDDVYIATEDRGLENYCNSIGLKTLRLGELQRELIESSTVKISDLKNYKDIKSYVRRYLLTRVGFGLVITGIIYLIIFFKNFFLNIYMVCLPNSFFKILFPIICVLGLSSMFFLFRLKLRLAYGIVELCIGMITAYLVFISIGFTNLLPINISTIESNVEFDDILKILGGLYITIRGADNTKQGLGNVLHKPVLNYIKRIYREHKQKRILKGSTTSFH